MNKAWRKGKPSSKSKHEIWKPRTRTQNVQNIDSKHSIIMKTWKKNTHNDGARSYSKLVLNKLKITWGELPPFIHY